MSDVTVDLDDFAYGIDQILSGVERAVKEVPEPAVEVGLKAGAAEWRANAPAQPNGGKYKKSIRWHLTKKGDDASGEIGSPSMPGLPHLLEKGHAMVGGGFVAARVHIAPAAEIAFDATMDAIESGIDEALR